MKNILVLLLFLGFVSVASTQITDDLKQEIDEICAHWMEGPGGVVGIVQDGELIFSKAYGLANLAFEVPNETTTSFNIASVSKQFTAYAIVLLAEQGKLSIDDDIRKFLPEVPDFGTPITIRHLLSHTSGLRNFQNLLSMAGWRDGDPMTNDDLLKYISMQKELNFPVGSEYLYCNTGFVLATFIVERITGMPFDTWTKQNIFNPLGMNDTEFREDMEVIMGNTAIGYDQFDDKSYRKPFEFYNYMGNGNIYTTVADLSKWIAHFDHASLGGMTSIESLTEPFVLNNGDTLTYALGIGVGDYRGLKRWSHGGSIGGYRSQLAYYPDSKTGFIALTNFNRGNPGGVLNQITQAYLGDQLEETSSRPMRYPQLKNATTITSEAFNKVAGHYMVDGVPVHLFEESGQFYLTAEGILPKTEIKPASDTSFFVPGASVSLYFRPGQTKENTRLIANYQGDINSGSFYDPTLSSPTNLQQYLGTYYSPELDTSYEFVLKDGVLTGRHHRHNDFKITPVTKDHLNSNSFFMYDIQIIRWATGDIKGIQVSNGRVRNLWFRKI